MKEGEVDSGLLHRPVGLDDQTVTEGDILLVVDPFDVGRRAPRHLLFQFTVAADGEVEQPLTGAVAFPAPLPCPIRPGGGPHPIEAATLDDRLGEGDIELSLGACGTRAIDVAVFGERERDAAPPFPGVGRLLGETVGGEIAVPGAESSEGADASGHELLREAEIGSVVLVGPRGEGIAGHVDVGVEGAHRAGQLARGDPPLPLHRLKERVMDEDALEHLLERQRFVAVIKGEVGKLEGRGGLRRRDGDSGNGLRGRGREQFALTLGSLGGRDGNDRSGSGANLGPRAGRSVFSADGFGAGIGACGVVDKVEKRLRDHGWRQVAPIRGEGGRSASGDKAPRFLRHDRGREEENEGRGGKDRREARHARSRSHPTFTFGALFSFPSGSLGGGASTGGKPLSRRQISYPSGTRLRNTQPIA